MDELSGASNQVRVLHAEQEHGSVGHEGSVPAEYSRQITQLGMSLLRGRESIDRFVLSVMCGLGACEGFVSNAVVRESVVDG